MKHMFTIIGGIIFMAGLSGCATFNDSGSVVSEQEDMNILREDLTRMQGRVETVELENRRMVSEVEKLRADSSDTRNQAALQERLDNLERRMQAMDAAREKDKQVIVDQLSAKIAEIMSKGSARPARSATAPAHNAPASGASGGEHLVKAGETLSAIATIYKVKASTIIEANDLKDPDNLRTGQKLIIPK